MDRNTLQLKAAQRLEASKRFLAQWATSTGKSRIALLFLATHQWMDNCLILVPEQNNIQNWKDEFNKFGLGTANVTIACYASFHKYKDTNWDLLVFDEVPHIDTELRKAVCRSVKGEYILALGAVVDDDEKASLEEAYGQFEVSTISLTQGIEWGIIPKPLICIIHLDMDDKKKKYFSQGQLCTAKEKYLLINGKLEKAKEAYEETPSKTNHERMLRCGNERKRFLGQLKEEAVRNLCNKLDQNERRYLCFCPSIKQANSIGGKRAFTSKTPSSMRTLDKFNNHEIDSLFVVSKLIEGQNLVDIERGVITQLGGTPRITVQMIGRVLRSKNPIVYIPVFDNTKDDSFLYTVTDNIPASCIKHYNSKSLF